MDLVQLPALQDNYMYVLHDENSQVTAVIDPSEAAPILKELQERNWTLTHVFNTHHHADHSAGNQELAALGKVEFISGDPERISETTVVAKEGIPISFGKTQVQVFEIPGHTLTHRAFYFPPIKALFSGDTLFTLGCGRLFEGTPEQMWSSLKKLRNLPNETLVYCGHEYTEGNARFALSVDSNNRMLAQRAQRVASLRRDGKPTVPATLAEEKLTNPFLRADDPALQSQLHALGKNPNEVFALLRKAKDQF